jgi:hypothetical protein
MLHFQDTDLEQEDIESFPQPLSRHPKRIPTRGRGRKHPSASSTLSPKVALSTSGSASTCPPIASRGKTSAVTFARKRVEGIIDIIVHHD